MPIAISTTNAADTVGMMLNLVSARIADIGISSTLDFDLTAPIQIGQYGDSLIVVIFTLANAGTIGLETQVVTDSLTLGEVKEFCQGAAGRRSFGLQVTAPTFLNDYNWLEWLKAGICAFLNEAFLDDVELGEWYPIAGQQWARHEASLDVIQVITLFSITHSGEPQSPLWDIHVWNSSMNSRMATPSGENLPLPDPYLWSVAEPFNTAGTAEVFIKLKILNDALALLPLNRVALWRGREKRLATGLPSDIVIPESDETIEREVDRTLFALKRLALTQEIIEDENGGVSLVNGVVYSGRK